MLTQEDIETFNNEPLEYVHNLYDFSKTLF